MINWINIRKEKPSKDFKAYLICGHEWFGIGYWKNNKWIHMLFAEFPTDFPDAIYNEKEIESFGDEFVMYWAEIPSYPIYFKD